MKRWISNLACEIVVGAMVIFTIPSINLNTISAADQYRAPNPEVVLEASDPGAIRQFVKEEAIKAGVNPELALFIIGAETSWREDVISGKVHGDGHLICNARKSPNYGKHQRARGLWQISDCWNYDVSDTVTFDIRESTKWALPLLKSNPEQWSTYKLWLQKKK